MSDGMVFFFILAVVVCAYGGACLTVYLTQFDKVFRIPRKGDQTPADWGLDYEEWMIDNQGKRLHAWWIPGVPQRPVVLFCHGNGVTIRHLAKHVQFLRPLKVGICLFDYQGYGDSDGEVGEKAFCSDAAAVWWHLVTKRGLKAENILVYGHSLGGGVATWLAGRHPCGGVILEGTFTSIPDLATDHYPWLPVRRLARIDFNNLAHIKKIKVPVLIAHSTEDEIIPFHHGETLFNHAGGPKRLLPIRGRHVDAFVAMGDVGCFAIRDFFHIG
ncbi:MAG: alpha/beta hydrolase [Nitrospirae bacterium]|nr:alpha/beta hydrolase [Magnetococcales bacterium]